MALKTAHMHDKTLFTPGRLSTLKQEELEKTVFAGIKFPLCDIRVRLLNEVGQVVN